MSDAQRLPDSSAQPRALVQLLAPGAGGVRDYAECLRRQWQQVGLTSHLMSLSRVEASEQSLAERLRCLRDQEDRPLSLLLHFSGYGFQKRGLCWWLVRELHQARRELGDRLRVVTMFHELFASGPPWQSAFWLGWVQASIARRMARDTDFIWTNTDLHARWLRAQTSGSVPVEVYPVFSTIGEPAAALPEGERAMRLVVFGSQSTRHRALDRLPPLVCELAQAGIGEVVEVGSGGAYPWTHATFGHRFVGRLDTGELRDLLERSAFGLIDYPPRYLGKSTVFAAYAAHGCLVLNTNRSLAGSDGLEPGRHFVSLRDVDAQRVGSSNWKSVTDAARHWYLRHALQSQAAAFAAAMAAEGVVTGRRGITASR